MLPVMFAVTLLLAVQWQHVPAIPTAPLPTAGTGPAADVVSTTQDAGPLTGDRTLSIAGANSATEEPDVFAANLDVPTTNPHVLSEEEDSLNVAESTLVDIPTTSRKDQDGTSLNPTTVTVDPEVATAASASVTATSHVISTYWDSLTASTVSVTAAQEDTGRRWIIVDTNPSTVTVSPVAVTTAVPKTTTPKPVCPAGCECEHFEVHCSRAGLVAFPKGLDRGTTYLDVGHNNLTAIADDELANLGLTKLTSLICDNNLIETVGNYAFRGLRDLALLQLSGNRIRKLSPFVFVGNDDLRHIDLTGNPLQLSYGQIFSIQQLEWLDLDNCNISRLTFDSFRDMRALRYINLSGNRISMLTMPHFHGLHYLRYVKLFGNPLVCDCELKLLWQWFKRQKVHVEAHCISPADSASHPLDYLEVLNCYGYRTQY